METEIKEKLMCVLKNRIHEFKERDCYKNNLYFKDILFSSIFKPIYKEVAETHVEKAKYFWQKDKKVTELKSIFDGGYWTAKVCYCEKSFELTQEEYNEIMEIREQKLNKITLEKLEELCK